MRIVTYEDFALIGSMAFACPQLENFSEGPWNPKSAAEALAENGPALIAFRGKKPAGFVIASQNSDSSAKILWCCFDEPSAGELLLSELKKRLIAEHINELTITLSVSNENGAGFYKKAGLTKIKETRIVCANENLFYE